MPALCTERAKEAESFPIRAVIFTTRDAADVLTMVEFTNRTCGVLRNGTLVDARRWPAARLVECVGAYRALCQELNLR